MAMKVLVAEDDKSCRNLLDVALSKWGYEVTKVEDGQKALAVLENSDEAMLAILDWLMPGMDGVEVCQQVRKHTDREQPYLILLTMRGAKVDVLKGLHSGANDYLIKPFDLELLRARVEVGQRVLVLQNSLSERVRELESALSKIRALQTIVPVCSNCRRIRMESNEWKHLDEYLIEQAHAKVSHALCPECAKKLYPEFMGD